MEKTIKKDIDNEKLFVSLAPHIRSNDTVRKIMLDVLIALTPAIIGSIYFFKLNAVILLLTCVISCVASEYVIQKLLKKEIRIYDLSAVVTGVLIAFNLPATFPWWMAAFGSIFAIVIIKECFGGIGCNFINPALGARIVLMASWAKAMTNYSAPDGVSTATPLQIIKEGTDLTILPKYFDMLIGNRAGVLGETSVILLLIGFIYLVIKKVVNLEIPIIYIISTAIFLFLFKLPTELIPYELISGGLILGACFMATDYTTTPINKRGRLIFALGCGIITAVIRVKGSLPEGVSYSICLMNVATPLIDKLTRTSAYGEAKK